MLTYEYEEATFWSGAVSMNIKNFFHIARNSQYVISNTNNQKLIFVRTELCI